MSVSVSESVSVSVSVCARTNVRACVRGCACVRAGAGVGVGVLKRAFVCACVCARQCALFACCGVRWTALEIVDDVCWNCPSDCERHHIVNLICGGRREGVRVAPLPPPRSPVSRGVLTRHPPGTHAPTCIVRARRLSAELSNRRRVADGLEYSQAG